MPPRNECRSESLRGIVPAGVPGVTFCDPTGRFPNPTHDPVPLDRFDRILAASRCEAAAGGEHWADPLLVALDKEQHASFHRRFISPSVWVYQTLPSIGRFY